MNVKPTHRRLRAVFFTKCPRCTRLKGATHLARQQGSHTEVDCPAPSYTYWHIISSCELVFRARSSSTTKASRWTRCQCHARLLISSTALGYGTHQGPRNRLIINSTQFRQRRCPAHLSHPLRCLSTESQPLSTSPICLPLL